MVWSFFDDAAAPSRHATQYHFLYGSAAIYHDGWKANFGYRPEVRELYDVESDPPEVHDMASTHPARLDELKAQFAPFKEVRATPDSTASDE